MWCFRSCVPWMVSAKEAFDLVWSPELNAKVSISPVRSELWQSQNFSKDFSLIDLLTLERFLCMPTRMLQCDLWWWAPKTCVAWFFTFCFCSWLPQRHMAGRRKQSWNESQSTHHTKVGATFTSVNIYSFFSVSIGEHCCLGGTGHLIIFWVVQAICVFRQKLWQHFCCDSYFNGSVQVLGNCMLNFGMAVGIWILLG